MVIEIGESVPTIRSDNPTTDLSKTVADPGS